MQGLKDITKNEINKMNLEMNFDKACNNKIFYNLVSSLHLPKKELIKYTSKFEMVCSEKENCQNCKGLFACQNSLLGHIFYPKVIQNKLYFTYLPCQYQKALNNKETSEKKLTKVTMKDINTKDKKQ